MRKIVSLLITKRYFKRQRKSLDSFLSFSGNCVSDADSSDSDKGVASSLILRSNFV